MRGGPGALPSAPGPGGPRPGGHLRSRAPGGGLPAGGGQRDPSYKAVKNILAAGLDRQPSVFDGTGAAAGVGAFVHGPQAVAVRTPQAGDGAQGD